MFQINQLDVDSVPALDCYRVGAASIEDGDLAAYDDFRNAMISRFADSTDVISTERIVKIALLLPASEKQMRKLDPLIDICSRSFDDPSKDSRDTPNFLRWRMLCVSLGEYRRGHFDLAETWARRSLVVSTPNRERVATARAILACSLYHKGHVTEAKRELALASDVIIPKLKEVPTFGKDDFWPDWIIARIILREAQALIL